jgi:hypothetical protein
MKKQALVIIGLLVSSTSAFAAPTGHQVCKNVENKVELVVATYAISGDPSILKIDGEEYGFEVGAGEGIGKFSTLIRSFCQCPPKLGFTAGEVKWNITQGDLNDFQSVDLTIIKEDKTEATIQMTCAPLDNKSGSEQDDDTQN